jgi:hypothetical protein
VNALIPKITSAMEEGVEVPGVVVVQNAIVAERSVTLRVRVLKRREVARDIAEEEDIVVSVVVVVVVVATKRPGRHTFHVFA